MSCLRKCLCVLCGLAVLSAGCGSTVAQNGHIKRDVENLALRIRHLEDRLGEIEQSMGGLAQKTLSPQTQIVYEQEDFGTPQALSSSFSAGLTAAGAGSTSSHSPRKGFTYMVQNALDKAGYSPGPIDGHMGPRTAQAIKRFQRDHRLKVTGSTTPATWRLLYKHLR